MDVWQFIIIIVVCFSLGSYFVIRARKNIQHWLDKREEANNDRAG